MSGSDTKTSPPNPGGGRVLSKTGSTGGGSEAGGEASLFESFDPLRLVSPRVISSSHVTMLTRLPRAGCDLITNSGFFASALACCT